MTNLEQRAEETAEWIATCNLQNGPITVPFMKEKILAALRQTREETIKEAKDQWIKDNEMAWPDVKEARRQALEEAANIVEHEIVTVWDIKQTANKLRALVSGSEKGK